MINNISSNPMQIQQQMRVNSSSSNDDLTISQRNTLADVLEAYDPNNLNSSDAKEIVNSLKAEGIEPSKALSDTMDDFGFNAKEIGELAQVTNQKNTTPPPPPPEFSEEEATNLSTLFNTIFSENNNGEKNSSFEQALDYTAKIQNLNDSSKSEVLSISNKFSSYENEFSKEDISNLAKNYLDNIVNNSDNYNSFSVYA